MSAIHCPECDEIVLTRYSKCPHCGCQIPMSKRYPDFYEDKSESYKFQNDSLQSNEDVDKYSQENTLIVEDVKNTYSPTCPRCKGNNISYQREQTASFGAGTNKVVVQQAKKSKGCLYWLCIGWWWTPIYWLLIGWWWKLLFGGRTKGGLNFNASKSINRTMAVCQNCGHSWKV